MKLQIALDFNCIAEALNFLGSVEISEDIVLEYGSPLIVNCGVEGYSRIKEDHSKLLYADTKTIDFPQLEWSRYASRGAKEVTALIHADKTVAEEMEKISRALGLTVYVSCMGVELFHLRRKVNQFCDLGFKKFIAHGADPNKNIAYEKMKRQLDVLCCLEGIEIVCAGGVDYQNLGSVLKFPVSRIVVGRSITRSSAPNAYISELCELIGL